MSEGKRLSKYALDAIQRYADISSGLHIEALRDLLGHVAALESEIARLKPSGQVAEDVAKVRQALISARHVAELPGSVHESLSRLATKAQGYEAAVADNAALVEDREIVARALGTFLPEERREWSFLMHRSDPSIWGDKVCASVGDDEAACNCPGTEQGRRVQAAMPVLRRLDHPRPGAALLEQHRKEIERWAENVSEVTAERDTERRLRKEAEEEHRKALVRARNEGLELVRAEAARQAGEYEALDSEVARDRAGMMRALAADISDLKEPEE